MNFIYENKFKNSIIENKNVNVNKELENKASTLEFVDNNKQQKTD